MLSMTKENDSYSNLCRIKYIICKSMRRMKPSKDLFELGKFPGLVVSVEDSWSERWSLDMGSNPSITQKLDGKKMSEKVMKK